MYVLLYFSEYQICTVASLFLFIHCWLYIYKDEYAKIEKECNSKLVYACYLLLAQLLPFLINDC
jgi:hypothetical protein